MARKRKKLSTYNKFVKSWFSKHSCRGRASSARSCMRAAAKAWRKKHPKRRSRK